MVSGRLPRRLFQEIGDPLGEATVDLLEGGLLMTLGRTEEAQEMMNRAGRR